jgi:sec-independent protein translocase protein TatA
MFRISVIGTGRTSAAVPQQEDSNMMGLGWQELAIILVIVVIIFGAGKLPEIGSGLGKGIRGFKEEAGLDEDNKKNEAIDKGSSKTASTLTASTKEARDEVVAGANKERREIRADEI